MTKSKKTDKQAPAAKTAATPQILKVQGLRAGHVSKDRESVTLEWVQASGETLGLEMPTALLDALSTMLSQVSLAAKTPAEGAEQNSARVMADFPRSFTIGEMLTDGSKQKMVLMQLMVPTSFGQSTRSFAFDSDSATKIASGIMKQAEALQESAK